MFLEHGISKEKIRAPHTYNGNNLIRKIKIVFFFRDKGIIIVVLFEPTTTVLFVFFARLFLLK